MNFTSGCLFFNANENIFAGLIKIRPKTTESFHPMNKPIKTGLLSFGTSGKIFHAPFLKAHEGFELTAVVERSVKKAQQFYPGIKSYGTVEELLADPNIELVVVNTPNSTHFEYTLKAIQANKHVLLEKVFTTNAEQARKLFEEAGKRNLHLLPYQNRRFDTDFASVKEVIESGKLGRLVEMHVRFDRFRDYIGAKAAKETPVPGSGLLYDLGPHLLDQVLFLFGKPQQWTKSLGHFREHTQVDDYANIHLSYADEKQVYVTTSYLVVDAQPAFVIHGTKGSYIKHRADVQEKQLMDGVSPLDPSFGSEEAGMEGILSTVAADGSIRQEKVSQSRTSYMKTFDLVYRTIRENNCYYVSEEQIIQQLKILEG